MPPNNESKEHAYSEQYRKQAEEKLKEIRAHRQKLNEIERTVKKAVLGKKRLKRKWIILGTVFILLSVLFTILLISLPNNNTFQQLDIITSNETASSSFLYEKSNIFSLSGWESKLVYNNTGDRLFGKDAYKQIIFDDYGRAYTVLPTTSGIIVEPLTTNPEKITSIGWFNKQEQISVQEEEKGKLKQTDVNFSSEDIDASYSIKIYGGKPYSQIQFSSLALEGLGEFAYGLTAQGYDMYLPTGGILKNDNEVIKSENVVDIILREGGNETTNISEDLRQAVEKTVDTSMIEVSRNGSTHEVTTNYELFYNPKTKLGIVMYSPTNVTFKNYFYWNVFQVRVPYLGDGKYPPLYMIVIENPELKYDRDAGDWRITSKQYTGYTWDYINQVVKEIDSGEAERFKFWDYFRF